jgi:hypothetical protein
LKYLQNRMPHYPKNRAKRRRFSNQVNQVIPQTDLQITFNSTNISTNSTTTAANSLNETQTATNLQTNNLHQHPMELFQIHLEPNPNHPPNLINSTSIPTNFSSNSTNISTNSQTTAATSPTETQTATNLQTNNPRQQPMEFSQINGIINPTQFTQTANNVQNDNPHQQPMEFSQINVEINTTHTQTLINSPNTSINFYQPTSFPHETANLKCNEMSNNTDIIGEYCHTAPAVQNNLESNKVEEYDLHLTINSQQNNPTQTSPKQPSTTNPPVPVALPNESLNSSQQWPTQLQPNSIITSSEGATLIQLQPNSKPTSSKGATLQQLQPNSNPTPSKGVTLIQLKPNSNPTSSEVGTLIQLQPNSKPTSSEGATLQQLPEGTAVPLATEHNHPPTRGASPPQLDSDTTQPNRTAITTSPDLTLKRRARTTEDRNSTQASQKETQRQQRRTTRSTLVDAAPTPPRWPCCNARCVASRTPLPEEFRCARTGNPMHYACAASPSPNGACLCHSCADPSPS